MSWVWVKAECGNVQERATCDEAEAPVRATSLHETQAAAARAAGVYLLKAGGGDLFIHRPNGRIRARRTIPAA